MGFLQINRDACALVPRKPDAICIGVQKAATSWLHAMLGQHPDTFMPPFKEQHFLDHMFVPGHRQWIPGHVRRGLARARQGGADLAHLDLINAQEPLTSQWYETVFARAGDRVAMDITPAYALIGARGVDWVRSYMPDVKVVLIIRDPVDRAVSQMRMNFSRTKMDALRRANWLAMLDHHDVISHSNYAKNFDPWLGGLGDKLTVVPYGMIRQAPDALLGHLSANLGLVGYSFENPKRHVHQSKCPPPPNWLLDSLAQELAPQYAYLQQEFGPEFCSMLK